MAHTDDTVLYSIDSVLYKHLNHETTEAEERRLYAWLEEREEHRTFYFEIAAIWSAHKTLSSKQKTENLSVRVLGTAFNVRAHAADPLTEVVLERGSVRLQTPEGYNLVRLHPNQRAVFDAAKDDIEVEEIYAEHFVTERYNLVAMKNATIGEIIARIESNYGVRIRIADPDNRKRYDINYLRTNSLEEVIDIVEFMTGQRCEVVRGK